MPQRIAVTGGATDLAEARAIAEAFAAANGLPSGERARLQIVLDELISNLARHGYAPGVAGFAEIGLCRDGDLMVLDFVDGGAAFDPVQAPPPELDAPAAQRPVGGLGLQLVRALADKLTYERRGNENHLQFIRRL